VGSKRYVVIVMDDPTFRDEIAAACREHDLLLARDHPPVQRDMRDAGLVFKERAEALMPAVTADNDSEKNSAAWNAWVANHLEAERDFLLKAMAGGMSEYVHFKLTERDAVINREINSLKAENAELRGMLTSALSALDVVRATTEALQQEKRERAIRDDTIRERSARIADLQRENAASHAELARKQRDQELAARDQRLELVETRLRMLCQFLSVGGYDLPRGF
jgi:hypothetical protein